MRGKQSTHPIDNIKNNDLVWILYRKQPWPAKVKRVYPKKITYNFLPAKNHPQVFSTALKNVKIFKETDKLPIGASDEQRQAYEIAMRLFLSGSEGDDYEDGGDAGTPLNDDNDSEVNSEDESENFDENVDNQDEQDVKDGESAAKIGGKESGNLPSTSRGPGSSLARSVFVKKGIDNRKQEKIVKKSSDASKKRGRPKKEAAPSNTVKNTTKKQRLNTETTATDEEFFGEEHDNNVKDHDHLSDALDIKTKKDFNDVYDDDASSKQSQRNKSQKVDNKTNGEKKNETQKNDHDYQPGDVAIVKTYMGMWPAKVLKVSEGSEIIYQMFPLETFLDGAKGVVEDFIRFPIDQIDSLIAENEGASGLCKAFKDVKRYLSKQNIRKAEMSPKEDKTVVNGDLALAKNQKSLPVKTQNLSASLEESDSKRPLRKRRHLSDNDETESNSSAGFGAQRNGTAENSLVAPKTKKVQMEVGKRFPDSSKTIKTEEALPPVTSVTRKRLGMSRTAAPNIKKEEPLGAKKSQSAANAKNGSASLDFLTILLSDETSDYLSAVWSGEKVPLHKASAAYTKPNYVTQVNVDFGQLSGVMTSMEELEAAVTEINKWITLCPKLPKMSLLATLHYIGNVALPEACIFALSKTKKLSLKEAAVKFQHLLVQGENKNVANSSKKNQNQGKKANSGNDINEKLHNVKRNDEKLVISLNATSKTSPEVTIPPATNLQQQNSVDTAITTTASQQQYKPFDDLLLAATIMQGKENEASSNEGEPSSIVKRQLTNNSSIEDAMHIVDENDDAEEQREVEYGKK